MVKRPEWEAECANAVVRGDAAAMRRAVALGLPLHRHVCSSRWFTPLQYAVNEGAKPAVVAVLLEAGAKVNAWVASESTSLARTPLMLAAYRGRLELIRLLLAAEADVHARTEDGITALACAAWGGKTAAYAQIVRELLAHGALPDAEAFAATGRRGSPEMVRLLAGAGADVNEVSRWGTALHLAVDEGRADTVAALLAAGADPGLRLPADGRSYGGQTALELSRVKKQRKIVPLLEAAVAGQTVSWMREAGSGGTLPEIWSRLEFALTPYSSLALNEPAPEELLEKLACRLGTMLPPVFHDFYLRHNGQPITADGLIRKGFLGLGSPYRLLTVSEVWSEWEVWKELYDRGEFTGNTAAPDTGIRDEWWHPGWLPLASNGGGDTVCIDLAPAEGGMSGQILHLSHEKGDRPRLTASLCELLTYLAEQYEQPDEPAPTPLTL